MYVKFPWHTVGRQSMAIMAMPVEEAWYFYDLFTSLAISSCMNNLLCTFQTEACSLDWRWRKQNYRPISLASPTPFTIDQLPQAENQNLPLTGNCFRTIFFAGFSVQVSPLSFTDLILASCDYYLGSREGSLNKSRQTLGNGPVNSLNPQCGFSSWSWRPHCTLTASSHWPWAQTESVAPDCIDPKQADHCGV